MLVLCCLQSVVWSVRRLGVILELIVHSLQAVMQLSCSSQAQQTEEERLSGDG